MKVIGVDPGTLVTGYGVVSENKGKKICHTWGAIKTGPGEPMPKRLKTITDRLREVIEEHRPHILALEESFFAKDAKAALKLGQARGAIMLVTAEAGLAFAEYSPLKIKQTLTGFGRAEKKQVQVMVRNILSLKENPAPLDASDALAVAITHLNHQGSPLLARS
ncbi:Crossover junction endodeoxyribonuclease RuvC [hydrothermal vent metagenome]|uniref:Crossover junction endodeoxyribonuclease RuvC n=1 Tax=hydrothermal vent metagenome TaxID=652676 RepID=A0A3B1CNL7_9ZZZZ